MKRRHGRPPLPAPRVPFPVEAEYRVKPDLRRMASDDVHFRLDSDWMRYLTRKLDLLAQDPLSCRVLSRPPDELAGPLWAVARQVEREHPWLLSLDGGRWSLLPLGVSIDREGRVEAEVRAPPSAEDGRLRDRVVAHLERLPAAERAIDLLALSVQEDLVILDGSRPGADEATLLHVCFPSRWDPGSRRGASFSQLHAPVPQSGRLQAASSNLVAAMVQKGPFERFVWSLTASPALDGHPERTGPGRGPRRGETPSATPSLLNSLCFRAERQTTRALGGGFALFTIRIYVAPLGAVLRVPGRAEALASAVRSMDAELLAYKGLNWGRDELVAELDGLSSASRDPLPVRH